MWIKQQNIYSLPSKPEWLKQKNKARMRRAGLRMVGRVWITSSSASDSISWFPDALIEDALQKQGCNIKESRGERNIRV